MTIAIIGANGFIGRHLTDYFITQREHRLLLFGRSAESAFGRTLPYEQLDQADADRVRRQFANVDLVYYLASHSIPASTWQKPHDEIEHNLSPFVRFLEALEGSAVKKICFVSSAGTIYGPSEQKLKEDAVKQPFSPYGITKLSMEYFLEYFRQKRRLQYDICRVANVYGEGQDTSKGLGLINTFLEKIIAKEPLQVYGTGEIKRNYIYVKDVAKLLAELSCKALNDSGVYNLASHDGISINQAIEAIRNSINLAFDVTYLPGRASDNSAILLDNSRLLARFPDFNFMPLQEGIKHTYDYLLTQHTLK